MGQKPFIKDGKFLGSVESDFNHRCKHPNAKETGETCRDGCCDYWKCPDCGKRWLVECPD